MSNAIETTTPAIAPEGITKADEVSVVDQEARIAALEAEKNKLIEEKSNYQVAYLKEKKKNDVPNPNEGEDEKIRRIAKETLADSRLAEIAREQETIIKQTLRENKELKLANANKTGIPSSLGSHTETKAVPDTLVTAEQLAAFKARGWKDKDIERYKKNLLKNTR